MQFIQFAENFFAPHFAKGKLRSAISVEHAEEKIIETPLMMS